MPFALKVFDDTSEYEQHESVLIIPCRFCPAASAAVKNNEPYLKLFRRFLKTEPYERFIDSLKNRLRNKGIRADIFRSRLVHQFVLCMWTSKRRAALKRRAMGYDALVVLGCEAAVQTIRGAVDPSRCKVIQGVRTEGIMSVKPKFSWSGNLSLELEHLSRYEYQAARQ